MAHQTTSIDNMGGSTLSGPTITNAGMKANDHMHISEDFIASPGVRDVLGLELKVTQNGTPGANVLVATGTGYVKNTSYTANDNTNTKYWRDTADASEVLTIAANASGNPRIDLICLKITPSAPPGDNGTGTGSCVVIQGTAAASPAVPSYPADGNSYEPLAQVAVANGFSTITNANITDLRQQVSTDTKDGWIPVSGSNYPNGVSASVAIVQYVGSLSVKVYDPSGIYNAKINTGDWFKITQSGSEKIFKILTTSLAASYLTLTLSSNGVYSVANAVINQSYFSKFRYPNGASDTLINFENLTDINRQAVMNGNFDVWQRSTSTANPTGTGGQKAVADRWLIAISNSGTLPTTITHSRQSLTSGDIWGSNFLYRIAPNGAGSGFGTNDYYALYQPIEHGTRFLAGASKKVTISFYAKSSITNKKIGLSLQQAYGSGGSPSATETIAGSVITLTSSWVKYTYTFTLNTLVGKTFGTNNDDSLNIFMFEMWGATTGTTFMGSGVAETFVGSGNIDIAQVQICTGDMALPFQPKSYNAELLACRRYCKVMTTSVGTEIIGVGSASTTSAGTAIVGLEVPMRVKPAITATASEWSVTDGVTSTALTSIGVSAIGGNTALALSFGVSGTPLTQYRPYFLVAPTAPKILILDSEL